MKRKIRVFAILMTTLLLLLALSGCSKKEGGESGGKVAIPLEQTAETHNVSFGTPKDFVVDVTFGGRGLDISPSDYTYTVMIAEETFKDMGTENFDEILEYHKGTSQEIDNPYGDIDGKKTAVLHEKDDSTDVIKVFVDMSGKAEGLDYLWIEIFSSDGTPSEEIYKKEEVMAILKSIKLK